MYSTIHWFVSSNNFNITIFLRVENDLKNSLLLHRSIHSHNSTVAANGYRPAATQCNNSRPKLARMRKIGNFLSENVGSHNVLKCSGYMERGMEKNLVVLKHDNHTPKSDGSQADNPSNECKHNNLIFLSLYAPKS